MATQKYSHFNRDDRKKIENHLNSGIGSLKIIAGSVTKSPKAVRNEIKRHRYLVVRENKRNKCGRQLYCAQQHLCNDCENGLCKSCRYRYCNDICSDFMTEPDCKRTNRFPFVCNGCSNATSCPLPKYFYSYERADIEASETASKQRTMNKTPMTLLKRIDEVVTEGLSRGLSIEVIVNSSNLDVSVSTVYRLIDNGDLPNVMNLDLKRKVRYKQKKSKGARIRTDPARKIGRTYEDFQRFLSNEPSNLPVWQMDTLIGKPAKEEKCVLSLLHSHSNLQLYFLLPEHTSNAVSVCFEQIRRLLGDELFKSTFPVILTDNGPEFSNPDSIERSDVTGEKLIHVFYCDAYKSQQKPKCEKNHEHFREMIPKGKSMNSLTQKDINFVSGNVNNYPRPMFNFCSPVNIALMILNKKVLELNKLIEIPIQSINLSRII